MKDPREDTPVVPLDEVGEHSVEEVRRARDAMVPTYIGGRLVDGPRGCGRGSVDRRRRVLRESSRRK